MGLYIYHIGLTPCQYDKIDELLEQYDPTQRSILWIHSDRFIDSLRKITECSKIDELYIDADHLLIHSEHLELIFSNPVLKVLTISGGDYFDIGHTPDISVYELMKLLEGNDTLQELHFVNCNVSGISELSELNKKTNIMKFIVSDCMVEHDYAFDQLPLSDREVPIKSRTKSATKR